MVSSGMNANRFELLADQIDRSALPQWRKLALLFSAWTISGRGSLEGLRQRQILATEARFA